MFILVFLRAEAIIVMNYTTKRVLELILVFVVHRDADSHGWDTITLSASSADIRQETVSELDVARLAILPEARSPHL